jgi:pilus assembly protein CpaF
MEGKELQLADRTEFMKQRLSEVYTQVKVNLPEDHPPAAFKDILDELTGYGPIQPLLEDPDISEVMVNGPKKVFIEKGGKLTKSPITFDDDDHVLRIIDRIILPLGRRVDADSPTVDARLPDGSRVNAVIQPVSIDGPSITIRNSRRTSCRSTVDRVWFTDSQHGRVHPRLCAGTPEHCHFREAPAQARRRS